MFTFQFSSLPKHFWDSFQTAQLSIFAQQSLHTFQNLSWVYWSPCHTLKHNTILNTLIYITQLYYICVIWRCLVCRNKYHIKCGLFVCQIEKQGAVQQNSNQTVFLITTTHHTRASQGHTLTTVLIRSLKMCQNNKVTAESTNNHQHIQIPL